MTDAARPRPAPAPWARAVIDYLGPVAFIVGFFVMHRNLSAATWWLVGGSAAALAFSLVVTRRVALLPLIWGGSALVFGLLTLAFHDTRFVKIKTTAIDGALGLFLLGSLAFRRGGGGGALRVLLGEAVSLSDRGWRVLTGRYGVFFLAMAGLNEAIWRSTLKHEEIWVFFRMPGLLILAGLFALTQLPMMMREAKAAEGAAAVAAELTQVQE